MVFVPVGLILQMSPWGIVVCVFARISYAFLFQSGEPPAGALLERRQQGPHPLPLFPDPHPADPAGILLAIFLVAFVGFPGGVVTGLLLAGLVNVPVALLLFYLLRNMLQYAEYTH